MATVGVLVVAGVVGGGSNPGAPAAARTQGVQSAAPAPPPAAPVSDASAVETAAPAPETTTTSSGPRSRPKPSLDRLLSGVGTTVSTTPPAAPVSPDPSVPPAEPASPRPPAAPPAPRTFTAQGQIVIPDLLGRIGIGLTNRGPVGGCGPSGSQGLDAYVFDLPADAPGPGAPVKATGSDLLGLHNLAVTFVSEDCQTVGELDTAAADEAGVLPAGTRYVVVSDRLGVGTSVTLTVG